MLSKATSSAGARRSTRLASEHPTQRDFDGDGTDELYEFTGNFNKSGVVTVYSQRNDCQWEPMANASSYASAGSPQWFGCRIGEDGNVEFVGAQSRALSGRLTRASGPARDNAGYIITEQVSRLVGSEWSRPEPRSLWVAQPNDALPGDCAEQTLPANPTDRPMFSAYVKVGATPSVTQSGPPTDRPCAQPPADQSLGPVLYVDLDSDGASEALAPTDFLLDPDGSWTLTHTVFTPDGACGWRDVGTVEQSQSQARDSATATWEAVLLPITPASGERLVLEETRSTLVVTDGFAERETTVARRELVNGELIDLAELPE